MNALFLIVALAVATRSVSAGTCDDCITTYASSKTAGAGDNAALCTAAKTAATCLLAATGTGCDTGGHSAVTELTTGGAVFNDAGALTDCPVSDVCTCQGLYQTSYQNRGASPTSGLKCGLEAYLTKCIMDATGATACDQATTKATIYATAYKGFTTECGLSSASGIATSFTVMCVCMLVSFFKF